MIEGGNDRRVGSRGVHDTPSTTSGESNRFGFIFLAMSSLLCAFSSTPSPLDMPDNAKLLLLLTFFKGSFSGVDVDALLLLPSVGVDSTAGPCEWKKGNLDLEPFVSLFFSDNRPPDPDPRS